MNDIKSRENSARRRLAKIDHCLKKTPARSWLREQFGAGYMVIDIYRNTAVLGAGSHAFDATLEDVEEFLAAA